MKKKKFDCVEMQDKAGEEIYGEIKGMTVEEELAYWHEKGRRLLGRPEKAEGKS